MCGPRDTHRFEGEYNAKAFSHPGLGKRTPCLQTEDDGSLAHPDFPGNGAAFLYAAYCNDAQDKYVRNAFDFDKGYVGESLESPATICDPKRVDVA